MAKQKPEDKKEMTIEREARILEAAIDYYGVPSQIDKAIEEMAELTKALLKHRHKGMATQYEWVELKNDIREELADVSIMLSQLEIIFDGYADQELEKLERLEELINK